MLSLKGAYFYLIALQITLVKSLKKIYFLSDYYNKSLQSETPKQVYYNPNPFLLSIITTYRGPSFKVSEINPNILCYIPTNYFYIEENMGRYSLFIWRCLGQ